LIVMYTCSTLYHYSGVADHLYFSSKTLREGEGYVYRTANDYSTEVQTFAEEILNTITHGMGLVLSIPAAILLVLLARRHGTIWHMYGCGLYGASLIVMYTCSTLYHYSGVADHLYFSSKTLRDLDHCAIYFIIAGTYTPLTLINLIYDHSYNPIHLKGGKATMEKASRTVNLGWFVLAMVWTMCVVGVLTKLMLGSDGIHPIIGYGGYLVMGWMAVFVAGPLFSVLPKTGLRLLVIGGLSYTIGMIFLLSDTVPFNHPVWHLFVGTGSILHYFCIIACSIPITKQQAVLRKTEHRAPSYLLDKFSRFAYATLMSGNV